MKRKGIERAASPGGAGEYSSLSLPPASYTVTVNAQGFAKAHVPDVVITVGGSHELPVSLGICRRPQKRSRSARRRRWRSKPRALRRTDTVGQRQIDNLPINGRNYINFTLTDSQVVRDNAPNTGAAPTSGLNHERPARRARTWSTSMAPTPPTIPSTACAQLFRRRRCRNFRSSPTATPPNTAAPPVES